MYYAVIFTQLKVLIAGFINTFLSWKGFIPLSKLTYTTYLIHPILIMYYVYSRKRLILTDDLELVSMTYILFIGYAKEKSRLIFKILKNCDLIYNSKMF